MPSRPQLCPGQPVRLTVLVEPETGVPARVLEASPAAIKVLIDKPADAGAAIRLEGENTLFLGEVRSCRYSGGQFALDIELRHALYNTQELARLARRLLHEDER